MKFNADYFIKKLKDIPDSKWGVGKYSDKHSKRCALGHCGERETKATVDGRELRILFRNFLGEDVSFINDGASSSFPQDTPKARVLSALKRIKELE